MPNNLTFNSHDENVFKTEKIPNNYKIANIRINGAREEPLENDGYCYVLRHYYGDGYDCNTQSILKVFDNLKDAVIAAHMLMHQKHLKKDPMRGIFFSTYYIDQTLISKSSLIKYYKLNQL